MSTCIGLRRFALSYLTINDHALMIGRRSQTPGIIDCIKDGVCTCDGELTGNVDRTMYIIVLAVVRRYVDKHGRRIFRVDHYRFICPLDRLRVAGRFVNFEQSPSTLRR